MRFDNIFQFIVPLTFLAIWALTSLFNREAQPLPPRTGRPFDPKGPAPPPGSASVMLPPSERRPEPTERGPRPAWLGPESTAGGRPGSEMVILESQVRRPTPAAPRPQGGGARRPARGRPTAPAAARKPEPATPRALSGALTMPTSPHLSETPGLKPLSLPQSSPLLPSRGAPAESADPVPPRPATSISADSISTASELSRERLREMVVLSEALFSPPLSIRNGPLPLRRKR